MRNRHYVRSDNNCKNKDVKFKMETIIILKLILTNEQLNVQVLAYWEYKDVHEEFEYKERKEEDAQF